MFKIKQIIFITLLIGLSISTGCTPLMYDPNLAGKVIDSESGKPIPGTVILGQWYKTYMNFAGGNSEFYGVSETVTDQQGDFLLKGKGVRFFTNLRPPIVTIFKAEYFPIYIGSQDLSETKGVIKLKKMNNWSLMRKQIPSTPQGPLNQVPAYIKEINTVRNKLGYEPYRTYK